MAHNDTMQRATVKSIKMETFGNPVDKSHLNIFLDTRWYEVDFPDDTVKEYTANIIV